MSVSALGRSYEAAPLGLNYFLSFVEEWKDLIKWARLLTLKIIIRSDMNILEWKIYMNAAIFLGFFFPLSSSPLFFFLLPSDSVLEILHGKESDARFG